MLNDIETPALVLDRAKVEANCARLLKHLATHDVTLRPHVKTAKSVPVTKIALGRDSGPITVSTLKEAEHFFAHGFTDILYAVGITPGKFARAGALRRAGCDLKVVLDTAEAAQALADWCAQERLQLPAFIEVDTDDHRAGAPPESQRLLDIGAVLGPAGLLGGVMTHAGNSYISKNVEEIRGWARQEQQGITRAAERLRAAGHVVPVVSLGSTPTAFFGESFAGVTEVRAGVYMFFDLVMVGLNVCALEDVAMSVATSVIGHQPEKGWVVTDGGWMAMSRDRGTQRQAQDQGYGAVCDAEGNALPDIIVIDANQEHGIVAHRDWEQGRKLSPQDFPVGRMLRVLPNHACATGAQFTAYHVLNGTQSEIWERHNGW